MRKIIADCCDELIRINGVDLIVTDPPYNINWKYSAKVNDKKKNYDEWCVDWFKQCWRCLNPNGVICVINYPENNNILFANIGKKNFVQQLIWCYNTNIGQSKRKYTRSYRTVLVYAKSKSYTFNPEKGQYKNPNDKRIKKRIEQGHAPNHYDVLNINLCKNVSKAKKKNGINQLPNSLCRFLIKSYSNEMDMVLDPFAGNFTIPIVAEGMNRRSIGIDKNDYDGMA